MNNVNTAGNSLSCPQRTDWTSFRLVDEHGDGKPYARLSYTLHDSQGQQYLGVLDDDGFAYIDRIYCGPAVLDLSKLADGRLDPWHERLLLRDSFRIPLTNLQIAAEQSPSGPRRPNGHTYLAEERAGLETALLLRVEVSDLVEAKGHLPDPDPAWQPKPSAMVKHNAGLASKCTGIALMPNCHHVLEVKALRAYSPLF